MFVIFVVVIRVLFGEDVWFLLLIWLKVLVFFFFLKVLLGWNLRVNVVVLVNVLRF